MGGYVSRLQDEKLLWLLEYMNGGSVDLDRGPSGEKESSQEREMSVAQVKSRLEREEPGRKSLYDYVVEKGFFRLGARVRCPNCSRHSWYALESIRDSLACPKCLDAFPAIGNLDAGGRDSWYYRTAGPFSIPNYADGAYAVLLTLDFFNALKLKSHNFHMTPVMSFTAESSENKRIEVDFAAFWQGGPPEREMELLIGESKTYGKFGDRDFERIRYLAEAFEKPVLVFSTLRKSLEPGERKKIGRIAKTSPVMVLTGNELCPYSGAESSGGSLGNQNLYYMSSLLDICDVTRERYIEIQGEAPKLTCNSPCCVRLIWSHAKIYVGQVKVDNVYVRL